jgi:TolB-like protein
MIRKNFAIFLSAAVLSTAFFLLVTTISIAYEKEINNLSASMAEQIAQTEKKNIAVVDFTDLQGNVTELGRFIAEEFSVSLAGAGKGFEVVDRTHLKSIIAEHKLSAKGIMDPNTSRQLGKIAGIGALITGTITPLGDSVRISVKVLDTETAKIITAKRGSIAKTKAIEELLSISIEMTVLSSFLCKIFISQFLKEWQVLTHFSYRV